MITDIKTLQSLIPTIINTSFDRYRQWLENAEQWLELNVTGTSLLGMIKAEGESSTAYSIARRVVAYKGYHDAIPSLDLVESKNGFAVVNDPNLLPASTARVSALITSLAEQYRNAMEQLQEHLETHPQYHSAWMESVACTILKDSLIPTLALYRNYGVFNGSRVDFGGQRTAFLSIIHTLIFPKVSGELVNELIQQTNDDSLTDTNMLIIHDLRFALSYYWAKDPQKADFYINKARSTIESNIDSYPTFKDSELYKLIAKYKPAEPTTGIGLFL